MRKYRIVCRSIVLSDDNTRILLARNKNGDFWYPPGGGLEETDESLQACAIREMKEETGLECSIDRLLYVQEFHPKPEKMVVEFFWLGRLATYHSDVTGHVDEDEDGLVEEVRWFSFEETSDMKIFPIVVKESLKKDLKAEAYKIFYRDVA